MVNKALLHPSSIVVVGGSDDIRKPGGKVLRNLIEGHFEGQLRVINPKAKQVQGIPAFQHVSELPQTECAILAIAARFCPDAVKILAQDKGTRAFIILSAGFSEESEEGKVWEKQIVESINAVGGTLIGPNCIGVLTPWYNGIFTTPIPALDPQGADLISGSGATALFIMDAGMQKGVKFASIFSVGNSAQTGVEDILEYLDTSFDPTTSSKIKLLYIERIKDPAKLLKHASSLVRKGCHIAAVKAGGSAAGSRAAASHTGALATPDVAVEALFRKAGIVRCSGRDELATVAGIFTYPPLQGKNIAIVTHAGGPAVMLADALSEEGMEIPPLNDKAATELLTHLFPGSSAGNPIDFLATGTAEQLSYILDTCEHRFPDIDGVVVIFGSPGLFPVFDVYQVLHQKMKEMKKPVFPVFPSFTVVKEEIQDFVNKGHVYFPDEVIFGKALAKVYQTPYPRPYASKILGIKQDKIRTIIEQAPNGYLPPQQVHELLDAAGIPTARECIVKTETELLAQAATIGYPLVMKVVGPLHKSDVGGVVLNVRDSQTLVAEFRRMIQIKNTYAILLAQQLSGTEIFVGAKKEETFGHIVVCGLGGIFVEVLKDIQTGLAPLSTEEGLSMIKKLKSYPIIQGIRGQKGVNENRFAEVVARVSRLVETAPEIAEMDLNPLLGNAEDVVAVDARIKIEK